MFFSGKRYFHTAKVVDNTPKVVKEEKVEEKDDAGKELENLIGANIDLKKLKKIFGEDFILIILKLLLGLKDKKGSRKGGGGRGKKGVGSSFATPGQVRKERADRERKAEGKAASEGLFKVLSEKRKKGESDAEYSARRIGMIFKEFATTSTGSIDGNLANLAVAAVTKSDGDDKLLSGGDQVSLKKTLTQLSMLADILDSGKDPVTGKDLTEKQREQIERSSLQTMTKGLSGDVREQYQKSRSKASKEGKAELDAFLDTAFKGKGADVLAGLGIAGGVEAVGPDGSITFDPTTAKPAAKPTGGGGVKSPKPPRKVTSAAERAAAKAEKEAKKKGGKKKDDDDPPPESGGGKVTIKPTSPTTKAEVEQKLASAGIPVGEDLGQKVVDAVDESVEADPNADAVSVTKKVKKKLKKQTKTKTEPEPEPVDTSVETQPKKAPPITGKVSKAKEEQIAKQLSLFADFDLSGEESDYLEGLFNRYRKKRGQPRALTIADLKSQIAGHLKSKQTGETFKPLKTKTGATKSRRDADSVIQPIRGDDGQVIKGEYENTETGEKTSWDDGNYIGEELATQVEELKALVASDETSKKDKDKYLAQLKKIDDDLYFDLRRQHADREPEYDPGFTGKYDLETGDGIPSNLEERSLFVSDGIILNPDLFNPSSVTRLRGDEEIVSIGDEGVVIIGKTPDGEQGLPRFVKHQTKTADEIRQLEALQEEDKGLTQAQKELKAADPTTQGLESLEGVRRGSVQTEPTDPYLESARAGIGAGAESETELRKIIEGSATYLQKSFRGYKERSNLASKKEQEILANLPATPAEVSQVEQGELAALKKAGIPLGPGAAGVRRGSVETIPAPSSEVESEPAQEPAQDTSVAKVNIDEEIAEQAAAEARAEVKEEQDLLVKQLEEAEEEEKQTAEAVKLSLQKDPVYKTVGGVKQTKVEKKFGKTDGPQGIDESVDSLLIGDGTSVEAEAEGDPLEGLYEGDAPGTGVLAKKEETEPKAPVSETVSETVKVTKKPPTGKKATTSQSIAKILKEVEKEGAAEGKSINEPRRKFLKSKLASSVYKDTYDDADEKGKKKLVKGFFDELEAEKSKTVTKKIKETIDNKLSAGILVDVGLENKTERDRIGGLIETIEVGEGKTNVEKQAAKLELEALGYEIDISVEGSKEAAGGSDVSSETGSGTSYISAGGTRKKRKSKLKTSAAVASKKQLEIIAEGEKAGATPQQVAAAAKAQEERRQAMFKRQAAAVAKLNETEADLAEKARLETSMNYKQKVDRFFEDRGDDQTLGVRARQREDLQKQYGPVTAESAELVEGLTKRQEAGGFPAEQKFGVDLSEPYLTGLGEERVKLSLKGKPFDPFLGKTEQEEAELTDLSFDYLAALQAKPSTRVKLATGEEGVIDKAAEALQQAREKRTDLAERALVGISKRYKKEKSKKLSTQSNDDFDKQFFAKINQERADLKASQPDIVATEEKQGKEGAYDAIIEGVAGPLPYQDPTAALTDRAKFSISKNPTYSKNIPTAADLRRIEKIYVEGTTSMGGTGAPKIPAPGAVSKLKTVYDRQKLLEKVEEKYSALPEKATEADKEALRKELEILYREAELTKDKQQEVLKQRLLAEEVALRGGGFIGNVDFQTEAEKIPVAAKQTVLVDEQGFAIPGEVITSGTGGGIQEAPPEFFRTGTGEYETPRRRVTLPRKTEQTPIQAGLRELDLKRELRPREQLGTVSKEAEEVKRDAIRRGLGEQEAQKVADDYTSYQDARFGYRVPGLEPQYEIYKGLGGELGVRKEDQVLAKPKLPYTPLTGGGPLSPFTGPEYGPKPPTEGKRLVIEAQQLLKTGDLSKKDLTFKRLTGEGLKKEKVSLKKLVDSAKDFDEYFEWLEKKNIDLIEERRSVRQQLFGKARDDPLRAELDTKQDEREAQLLRQYQSDKSAYETAQKELVDKLSQAVTTAKASASPFTAEDIPTGYSLRKAELEKTAAGRRQLSQEYKRREQLGTTGEGVAAEEAEVLKQFKKNKAKALKQAAKQREAEAARDVEEGGTATFSEVSSVSSGQVDDLIFQQQKAEEQEELKQVKKEATEAFAGESETLKKGKKLLSSLGKGGRTSTAPETPAPVGVVYGPTGGIIGGLAGVAYGADDELEIDENAYASPQESAEGTEFTGGEFAEIVEGQEED